MENQPISGSLIFKLKDTYGLPLEISLEECKSHNLTINWVEYAEAAKRHGWKDYQIIQSMQELGEEYVKKITLHLMRSPRGTFG